jgi:adenylosuccinate synthase
MTNSIVVGLQCGNEGKAKIIDYLSNKADVIIRFQGDYSEDDTIIIDDITYNLSILPSSIIKPDKISIIGTGVSINPKKLLNEIIRLKKQGVQISPSNLMITDNAPLTFNLYENGLNAYEDKVARRALRVCDLADKDYFFHQLDLLIEHHNNVRKDHKLPKIDRDSIVNEFEYMTEDILPYTKPIWKIIDLLYHQGKKILFQGTYGAMLDIDHGTYPYVNPYSTIAAQAFAGSGFGRMSSCFAIGVIKTYMTRNDKGPFPNEIYSDLGNLFAKRGNEKIEQRRFGWFDAVAVRQYIKISGISYIVLTKLDVLDGINKIKICVGYKYRSEVYDYLPSLPSLQKKLEPIYEEVDGWSKPVQGKNNFDDLPQAAKNYIKRIEELIHTPIIIISTGIRRDDMIIVKDLLN